MSNSWVIAGIAVLCLLCGFVSGSFVSGRKLDQCWEQAWDACASKVRRRQLAKMNDGLVLRLGADGEPGWFGGCECIEEERYLALCAERGVPPIASMIFGPPEPDNGSHLPSDRQVRAELAAIAGAAPAPPPPPGGAGQEPRPGTHPDHGREDANSASSIGEAVGQELERDARPGPGDPVFSLIDDDHNEEAFRLIRFDFERLKRLAAEPFRLTEWRMA